MEIDSQINGEVETEGQRQTDRQIETTEIQRGSAGRETARWREGEKDRGREGDRQRDRDSLRQGNHCNSQKEKMPARQKQRKKGIDQSIRRGTKTEEKETKTGRERNKDTNRWSRRGRKCVGAKLRNYQEPMNKVMASETSE